MQFFPGYGCVLIFHNDIVQRHDSLSITILGLDSHDHVVHSGHNQYQFSSIAQNYAEIHVGEIGLATKQDFLNRFQKLLDKASCRKGDKRSAAGGKQGHQKTPAFIHALLVQALNYNCPEVLPRGGFTDVGLHTGGEARDTSFALVRSLCMWNMNRSFYQDQEVLDKESSLDAVMLYFHSFVLENAIQAIKESTQGDELSHSVLKSIAHLWAIMKVICTTAAPLSDEGHDLSAHFVSMTLLKETIMSVQSKWHQACRVKNTIEYTNPFFYAPPIFVPPVASFQTREQRTKSDIKLLVKENIDFIPTFFLHKKKSWNIASAHEWAIQMKSECTSSSSCLSVYLRQIEKMFWNMSKKYLDEPLNNTSKLVHLAGVLDCYRESVNHCVSSSEAKHFSSLHVRMRSIELLATWLVYCIIFKATRSIFPTVLEGFGVALRFQDLSHLVLQDEKHIVVLKRVIHFLGENHVGEDKEVFSMRHDQGWDSATFEMGLRYSKLFLSSTLAKEKVDAEERVTKHWLEVRRRYTLAAHLSSELEDLREDLDRADKKVCKAEDNHYYWSDIAQWARSERNSTRSLVNRKEAEVEEAEKAPPPVIQPLPSNDDKALKILYFMNMSDEFKVLSRLSLIAQQLLVPRPWEARCGGQEDGIQIVNVFDQIKVEKEEISWCDHYNTFQTCTYHTPSEERKGSCQWVDISMHLDVPRPTHLSSSGVEYRDRRKGIWYPDNNNVRLVWHGGSLAKIGTLVMESLIRLQYDAILQVRTILSVGSMQ
jgi:hypothetical protein